MSNNIYRESKVVGIIALSLCLSACGSGLRGQATDQLATSSIESSGAYVINNGEFAKQITSEKLETKEEAKEEIKETPVRKPSAAPTQVQQYSMKKPAASSGDSRPDGFRSLDLAPKAQERILERFTHLDPQHEINTELLKKALMFYFVNQLNLPNKKVMTVIDYSVPSDKKRLFVINLQNGRVWSTYVAHGKGSDRNHDGIPEVFTNKHDSNATSLGAYLTMNSYKGDNGLSLRLKGLSKSNSNAYDRNVVIHGAWYVKDNSVKQGRSQGCPAVATKYTARLISLIKGGSLVYAGASKPSLHRQM